MSGVQCIRSSGKMPDLSGSLGRRDRGHQESSSRISGRGTGISHFGWPAPRRSCIRRTSSSRGGPSFLVEVLILQPPGRYSAFSALRRWGRLLELELQRGDHARFRNRDGRLGRQRRPDDSGEAFLFRCQGSIALGMDFTGARRDALGQEQAPVADDLRFLLWTAVPRHSQQSRVEQMPKVSLIQGIVGRPGSSDADDDAGELRPLVPFD